jgi:hypothetical protein
MVAVTVALAGGGCGPKEVEVHPVQGKVLYRGKAAAGAVVVFQPSSGSLPPGVPMPPTGTVKADGTFQLRTYHEGDGAPLGDYKVVLHWPGTAAEGEEATQIEDRLEGRYSDPQKPLLLFQVKPGSNDVPTIQLK